MIAVSKSFSDPVNAFNPENNPFTPIFPVPDRLNPFVEDKVDIYPISPYWAFMPNIKAFMVRHMLEDARSRGKLEGVHTLWEATSGNTGCALGILAPDFGIRRVVAVVERDTAPGKLEQLRMAGVDISFPEEGLTTIQTARIRGSEKSCYNPDQYSNDANWQAHFKFTGPHIWLSTKGQIGVLSAALGTTGTVIGASKYLRSESPRVKIIGAACAPDNPIPGARTLEKLKEIAFDWRSWVDAVIEVERYPAFKGSLELFQSGGNYGPSSGLAREALHRFICDAKDAGELDNLRNSEGRLVAAFICGDSALPYLDKYSTILDGSEFSLKRNR